MALLFGAIADDLTGGLELAAMLRAQGIGRAFVSDPALIESSPQTERSSLRCARAARGRFSSNIARPSIRPTKAISAPAPMSCAT